MADTLQNNSSLNIVGTDAADNLSNSLEGATIQALGGNDSVANYGANVIIDGGADNDQIYNEGANVIISASSQDDAVYNYGANVSIDGGAGNDSLQNVGESASIGGSVGNDLIYNQSANVTIVGGADNDTIYNESANVLFRYDAGEGNDIINGFNATSTLRIMKGEYTRSTVSNDVILTVGANSITLTGAATLANVNIVGTQSGDSPTTPSDITPAESNFVVLTEGDDDYSNSVSGATIAALGGNDEIFNHAVAVSINGGNDSDYFFNTAQSVTMNGANGNDSVYNESSNAFIFGDAGNDSIVNSSLGGGNVIIDGGLGNDEIFNQSSNVFITSEDGNNFIFNSKDSSAVSILSGAGNDSVSNLGANVVINVGAGNNVIISDGDNVTINSGDDADFLVNDGDHTLIDAGNGNDSIDSDGDYSTINAGNGNDNIYNDGDNVTISGGNGNEFLVNDGSNVTINTGAGNDSVSNTKNSIITYLGAGSDYFFSADLNASVNGGTGDDTISFTSSAINNLIRYSTGDGNDLITGIAGNSTLNITAENYSSVTSGNDVIIKVGDGSITLKDIGNNLPHIVINGSGGGSSGGGSSGGGSSGGSSSGGGSSGGGSSGGGSSGGSSSGGSSSGGSSSGGSSSGGGSSGNGSTTDTVSQIVYMGGDMLVSDYQSGEEIIFGVPYTGSACDGGNFSFGSETGALVLQNVADKLIDLRDGAGNPFVKAYVASSATTIDGRNLAGFEIINGSTGSDEIFAGDGGSQLWGGADNVGDTLTGGNGVDIFIGGKAQGGDIFRNASSADVLRLSDATLNDIVETWADGGTIALAFNTGNTVIIQSSESLSTKFTLADGSSYRFNHETKTWHAEQIIYTGGDMVISNYAGEKIILGTLPTAMTFGGEDFYFGTDSGTLILQNVKNKLIDFTDAAGNPFAKAYASSTAGIIDGRNLAGFEIINGSTGSDEIFAGNDGSQLWGGADNVSDILTGGNGVDIFIGGKNQGADAFLNASSADIVNLNDAVLSDIVSTAEDNGAIAITFANGNDIAVQSSESISAKINLADGSSYRFNHETKSWQSA